MRGPNETRDNEAEEPHPFCVQLRARIATDIASGARLDDVATGLIGVLEDRLPGSMTSIQSTSGDLTRLIASNAPSAIRGLMHDVHRRRWFGSWGASLTRQAEMFVPDVLASSLYREHRAEFEAAAMLAAWSAPLRGRHSLVGGAISIYLSESRVLDRIELELANEVASLTELAMRANADRQDLLDQIRRDPLTGLENRDGLEDKLASALTSADRHDRHVGLLFVDIDDLTLVNDSLGHTAGDTIIATTADRIRGQLLPGDAVVRFGGDEFIVVIERVDDAEDAERIAERLRSVVGEPIRIDETDITPTVSIGITTSGPHTSPLDLVDEGHAAVVRAKQSGRASTARHDRQLDTGAGARLGRETRLREALDHHEFILHWQPKISLATGTIIGAEALVRWEHPELGLVGPDQFIHTAERSGVIRELSEWVVWQAIREATELAEIHPDFSAAVNLSASQLTRADIAASIAQSLASNELDPSRLIVELTESAAANVDVVDHLVELRALGIHIAIDDFGTGYSSLAYVQQLPVQMVKIDRAFLSGLDASGSGAPVLQAAVAMAHALGLSTTVEGVETVEQLAGLRALHVKWVQGYLIAEPSPQADLVTLMLSNPSW
ncbi:MAG: putative bifunctional diguanylate cyclase/phosphodiesterase [Acidimicrobiales bacterium]